MKKLKFITILVLIGKIASSQNASYVPFYTNSTFNAKTIDVSKPVGALNGSADVSNGTANYVIPILAPPRPEGGTPSATISLSYNSMASDDVLGRGWNITGISSIQRVQKTIAFNSKTQPSCTIDDEYLLDGQKLLKDDPNNVNTIETWKTEIENFSTITSYRDGNNNIYKWEIITKDGNKLYYGESPYGNNTRIFASNSTGQNTDCNKSGGGYVSFYLDYMEFPNSQGRWYHYHYPGNRTICLSQISDNYGTISFNYKNKSWNSNTTYLNGRKFIHDVLLDNISVENYSGTVIKKYNFKYSSDFINNYLSEIEEEGADGTKLNPTIILYGEQKNATTFVTKSGFFSYPIQSAANGVMSYQAGDFNGDGITDIVSIDQTTAWPRYTTGYRVFINNGNNGYNQSYIQTGLSNVLFHQVENKYLNFSTSDFNGDGIDDIAIHNVNTSNNTRKLVSTTINYFDNAGNVSNSQTISYPTRSTFPSGNFDGIYPNWKFYYTGDFNGDGGVDYLLITSNGTGYRYFLSFPSLNIFNVNLNEIGAPNPNYYDWEMADDILVLDMDGDGKSEMMIIKDGTTKIYSINKIGTSNDYEAKIMYNGGFPTKWHKVILGDFNGDRKTDLITKSSITGYDVSLSTGNSFDYATTISFQETPNLEYNSQSCSNHFFRVSDFNGDGKSDIIHTYLKSGYCNHFLDIYYSLGNSFARRSHDPQNSNYMYFHCSNSPVVGDFNGDGKSDLNTRTQGTWSGSGCSWNVPITDPRMHVFFDENGKELIVNKIKNGFGAVAEYTYNTLSKLAITRSYNGNNNHRGNLYYKFPINVVTSFKNDIGNIDNSYTYYGATFNKKGRGFLGFRQIDQYDYTRNDITSIYLNKYGSFTNYPDIVFNDYIEKKRNGVFLESKRLYYTPSINNGIRVWMKNYKIETSSYLGGNTTTNLTYDNYGNITTKEEINADNNATTTTYNYGANETNKPALPLSSTITYNRTGTPSISYTSNYDYTSQFQLSKKTDYVGLPKTVITEYLYNYMGNIIEEKVTGTGMTPRKSEIVYDPNNDRFIQKKKNSLGQEVNYIMDEKWNIPLSVTEVNGLTITNNYDGFGRKIAENLPTGKVLNTQFIWDNTVSFTGNHNSIYKIKNSTTNSPIDEIYYDKYGRVLAEKSQQFDGTYNVSQKTYNPKNQIILTNNYSSTGQLISGIESTYDVYDRLTSTDYIDQNGTSHNISNTSFNKGTSFWEITESTPSSTSNSSGISKYTKISFAGDILELKENGSNSLTFQYNAQGNKLKVLNGSTTLAENEYDVYGRHTKMIDNSAGTQTYIYNALGEITQQTNPNNGFIKFEYDVLGRKTKEIINEGTITYTYYPIGSGVKTNLIKEVKGYNNLNKEEYNYDAFGRLNHIKKTINGSPVGTTGYITQFTYNSDGNIIQKQSASGKTYDYLYNSMGYLEKINKGAQNIYTLSSTSIAGKPSLYNLGSTQVSIAYNDFNRPNRILSNYIDESYVWDNINGNLLEKEELNKQVSSPKPFTYNYQYDNFERLKEENLDIIGLPTIPNPLNYHADGRIDDKYSVTGAPYVYHTNKKYAVANIFDAYDFSPYQQNIKYSSFNKATELNQNGYKLTYTYNHKYERISGVLSKNGAVQNKRFYIGTTDFNYNASNSLVNSVDYIYAGDQLVAMDVSTPNRSDIWYVQQNYQNSIRAVFNDAGQVYYQNFDAWGNYRNNDNASSTLGEISYERPTNLPIWLYRGYTEQEHLPEFRLINLNARLYDPHVARMLSPDNFVTANSLQGFNRYSYAHNNPIKYSDPDGNDPITAIVIGAVIGAYIGGVTSNNSLNPFQWDYGKTWINILAGGVAGGVGGGMGAWMNTLQIGGIAGGAISGGAAGFAGAATTGVYNYAEGKTDFGGFLGEVGLGTLTGAAIGGAIGGLDAAFKGDNIWNGRSKEVFTTKKSYNVKTDEEYRKIRADLRTGEDGHVTRIYDNKNYNHHFNKNGDVVFKGRAKLEPGQTFEILKNGKVVYSQDVSGKFNQAFSSSKFVDYTVRVTGRSTSYLIENSVKSGISVIITPGTHYSLTNTFRNFGGLLNFIY